MYFELVEIGWLVAAVVVSVVASKIVSVILGRYVKKLTEKTHTTLDDKVLEAVDGPISMLVIVFGTYVALNVLPSFYNYLHTISIIFSVSVISILASAALKLVDALLAWYADEMAARNRQILADFIPIFRRVAGVFIIFIAAIMVLGQLGIEVTPLLASLGIAGLAVALAFQDTLMNFFAGVNLTADRPIRVGNYIKLENGEEGYVEKIGWRSTSIRTLSGNLVIVPNSKISQTVLTNYALPHKEMSVVIPVSVSYDSDLEKVEKITVDVAGKIQKNIKGAVPEFKPFIRYNKFGDSGIGFSVILRVNEFVDKYLVTHEFVKALHLRFRKEKIEIPYPKQDVYVKSFKK